MPGWEKELEHMRDYGHTWWGSGDEEYRKPTDAEQLESDARFAAYEKELEALRVPAREKYLKAGETLEAGLPSSHDISFGTAPFNWREDYSTAKINFCKEAAEELGYVFEELHQYPKELKNEFFIKVERYGFLPGKDGNIHHYVAKGIEDPLKCLQLVADFDAIGCSPTTYWMGKKVSILNVFCFTSESNTGRLCKEMLRWGVPFDKKEILNKEIKQLAADLDQFVYDFDTHGYHDAVDDREQAVFEIARNIEMGNTGHIKKWHQDITYEDYDLDTALESMTLIKWLENVEKKIQLEKVKETESKKTVDAKIDSAKEVNPLKVEQTKNSKDIEPIL